MISTTGSALKVTTKKIMKNYDIVKKINPKKNVAIGF
jgi:tryptophan synthase alpha chain